MEKALKKLESRLKKLLARNPESNSYAVPALWENPYTRYSGAPVKVNPFRFYLNSIKAIRELAKNKFRRPAGHIVYNILVRYASAFDHNGDGEVRKDIIHKGFRETGTFLKTIAMLPYIKSFGADILYMLPITTIGYHKRKGNLGSPYAIKNPYKIDVNLSEPVLNMDVTEQFAALVEAAHLLGMKVITEFVFRTASIDSELALEHPEWFYWIKANIKDREQGSQNEKRFGPPVFSPAELRKIKKMVEEDKVFKDLPEPHDIYKDMYTNMPQKVAVVNGVIRGVTGSGIECRIPGAFCDWPPDDVQPLWSDVTYLKMYDQRNYNYMAYNTLRMYEEKFAKYRNRVVSLWDNICEIIPFYQESFGIDGVMIDMGHALPHILRAELIRRAKEFNDGFVFWEENFSLTAKSVREGYSAAVGYLWISQHIPSELKRFIKFLSDEGSPIAFFATPETHNTPRTASRIGETEYSRVCWLINAFLPGLLFIHSGYEIGETAPVNTGLGFTVEQQHNYPAEKLPLFSIASMNWQNQGTIIDFMRQIIEIRDKYLDYRKFFDRGVLEYLDTPGDSIIAFSVKTSEEGRKIVIIVNMDTDKELYFAAKLPKHTSALTDILSGFKFNVVNNEIIYNLKPLHYILGITN